jgi:hypothetical protein
MRLSGKLPAGRARKAMCARLKEVARSLLYGTLPTTVKASRPDRGRTDPHSHGMTKSDRDNISAKPFSSETLRFGESYFSRRTTENHVGRGRRRTLDVALTNGGE